MKLSKKEARERAERSWHMWRLLLSNMGIMYSDLNQMSHEDIAEANAALDIHLEMQKKAAEAPKK